MTAEVMNWTGKGLAAPRFRLGELIRREEASRTGIYVLNRFVRWARRGLWENLFRELAGCGRSADTQMIDSTHVKAHRSASGGNRKQPFSFSKRLYKLRWRIESAFNRLKDFRRIATRYDRLARNYLASVCLAAALVWWI